MINCLAGFTAKLRLAHPVNLMAAALLCEAAVADGQHTGRTEILCLF